MECCVHSVCLQIGYTLFFANVDKAISNTVLLISSGQSWAADQVSFSWREAGFCLPFPFFTCHQQMHGLGPAFQLAGTVGDRYGRAKAGFPNYPVMGGGRRCPLSTVQGKRGWFLHVLLSGGEKQMAGGPMSCVLVAHHGITARQWNWMKRLQKVTSTWLTRGCFTARLQIHCLRTVVWCFSLIRK